MNKPRRIKYRSIRKVDRQYNEISTELKAKDRDKEAVVEREMYVDSYRGISVQLTGPEADLRVMMEQSGHTANMNTEGQSGSPNDFMYLKQAEHLMRKSAYRPALQYLQRSLELNPESKLAQANQAKCHLLMGNWALAMEAAEQVLAVDKTYVKALLVKAESLYHTCDFEHALMYYHRGHNIMPDHEHFRLGIQKCKQTIQDGIKNESVFQAKGVEVIFHIFRRAATFRSQKSGASRLGHVPLGGLSTILTQRKTDGDQDKTGHQKVLLPAATDPYGSNSSQAKLKRVRKRCREKARTALSSDRLLQDKMYLASLAACTSPYDPVIQELSNAAEETLEFLNERDEFWNQLKLGRKSHLC